MVISHINCSIPYLRNLVGFQTIAYVCSHNHDLLCGHYFCAGNCAWHWGCNREQLDPTFRKIQGAMKACDQGQEA